MEAQKEARVFCRSHAHAHKYNGVRVEERDIDLTRHASARDIYRGCIRLDYLCVLVCVVTEGDWPRGPTVGVSRVVARCECYQSEVRMPLFNCHSLLTP